MNTRARMSGIDIAMEQTRFTGRGRRPRARVANSRERVEARMPSISQQLGADARRYRPRDRERAPDLTSSAMAACAMNPPSMARFPPPEMASTSRSSKLNWTRFFCCLREFLCARAQPRRSGLQCLAAAHEKGLALRHAELVADAAESGSVSGRATAQLQVSGLRCAGAEYQHQHGRGGRSVQETQLHVAAGQCYEGIGRATRRTARRTLARLCAPAGATCHTLTPLKWRAFMRHCLGQARATAARGAEPARARGGLV